MKRATIYRIPTLIAYAAIVIPAATYAQSTRATSDTASVVTLESTDASSEWLHWTSGRYRMTPGDVLEFRFPFVPELDQTVTVQPDGFISLKEIPDVKVQGRTLDELKASVVTAYQPVVREPSFTVTLTQFEKPYFVASGQVKTPRRYELRGATTVTQALAFAGGTVSGADLPEVLLVRSHGDRASP